MNFGFFSCSVCIRWAAAEIITKIHANCFSGVYLVLEVVQGLGAHSNKEVLVRHGTKTGSILWTSGSLPSETGRIRFRGVRFQTPNSVSFLGLAEFGGPNSVSSFQPIICVQTRTHRVSRRTHRVCRRTQWVLSSETVLSKQYSARSPFPKDPSVLKILRR